MDLSSFDNLSSIDMTTQLAKMVIMMTQSKGGQFTSHIIIFLTGLVGVNRKSEVGPLSSGSFSFFFFLILPPFQMLLRTYFFSYSIWTTLSLLLLHFWWTFKINLSSGGQYWQIETHYHCYHLYHITPFQTLSDPNLPPSSSGRRDPQLHIVTSGEEIWNNYYTSNTSSTSGPILLYFN